MKKHQLAVLFLLMVMYWPSSESFSAPDLSTAHLHKAEMNPSIAAQSKSSSQ